MGIAFFDLDGTITRKDTFIEFIKFVRGKFYFYFGQVFLLPYIVLFFIKLRSNSKLKEDFFTFFFKKYSESELINLGIEFSQQFLPKMLYREAMEKIDWHKSRNDKIVILTASSSIWLSHWCYIHNMELIGTNYETIDGKFTGKIDGENCYGKQKMKIVQNILLKDNYSESYGYGDSKSDLHFISLVKHQCYRMFKK